jgi:hypothetical protein
MEAYKPIGAPVPGGAGCGGKFLSTTTGHENTIPFPTIPANQRLNGFWVTNDMALSGDVQVISFSNFWCEIPASEGGCPATIAPPDKNPVVPGLPEPASVSLLLLGLAGLGFERWRSRHGRGGRIRVNEI